MRDDATGSAEPHPLTEAQAGLWYAQRLDPANPILNTGQYLDLRGPLDVEAFRRAVDQAVRESDALALRFTDGVDGPRQIVDERLRPWLDVRDMSAEPDPAAAALADIRHDAATPIDVERGPLAAFRLYRLSGERFFWYERIHHLAIDGYGMVLFTNRVADFYSSSQGGAAAGPAFPQLREAFLDDAAYAGSAKREQDRAFWRGAMAGAADAGSMAPGRAVSAPWFHRETLRLSAEQMERLRALADAAKVTWPDALTALVAAYCRRFTGASEIVVGVPHMGRLGNVAARIPCTLMNVLPLRFAADESAPMAQVLVDTAKTLRDMRRHGRFRSEQLRRELGLIGGDRRLFGALINVQPFDLPPKMKSVDVSLNILGAGAVDDITFTFRGDARQSLSLEVDANPNLYAAEAVRDHAARLVAFLNAAASAATIADVPTASPQEARRYLFDVNETDHPIPDTTLVALIEQAFRERPDDTALVFDAAELSYRDLDRRSAALADRLAHYGAMRETIVAIALPRSVELIVALVAILRSGAAYLPLDTEHPRARLQRILASARPVCVLTTPQDSALLAGDFPLLLTTDWPVESGALPAAPAEPADMAYVIYTSGSTGEPKGVVIEHRAIVNRLLWMRDHYGFGPHDRILQKTPATFDVSVWEFFLPLIVGATLVVAPPGAHRDPTALAALIRQQRVTTAHFVPSMLSAFLSSPAAAGLELARVFCSGEELSGDLRDRFHRTMRAQLHNLYGPTEAAVDVTWWDAGPDDRSAPVPIGWPVWNTRLYILDDRFRAVPPGVAGHLFLAGVQLARGYLGQSELTADRFIADPFVPGERMYRTGDLARWRRDGAVEFLGRSDFQVKVRGLRIELGEIEAAIMACGLAKETAVIAREDRPGDRRLVAYVVPRKTLATAALRRQLAARLPDYMVPAAFVEMDALPVNANGKLDRPKLPAPKEASVAGRAPATATELILCGLVAEALDLKAAPGPDDDFFELGGDSLSAVRLTLLVAERLGRDPGLGAIFEHPVIAALAAALDDDRMVASSGLAPLIRLAEGAAEAPPLFVIHPAGGISWCYRSLARALAPKRSVYGLQSPALDPAQPLPDSLDALAAEYVARIRSVHPDGPYHLAGWSVGGILAQAMAVRLRASGASVGLVALLDAYPSECWRAEPEPDEAAALRALLAIAGFDPNQHQDLDTREAVIAFLRRSASPLGQLPGTALDGVARLVLHTNRLVRGHRHAFYDGALTHIRAGLDHAGRNLTPDLWLSHAARVDSFEVPFLHPQMPSPAATALIAPELARRLKARETLVETV